MGKRIVSSASSKEVLVLIRVPHWPVPYSPWSEVTTKARQRIRLPHETLRVAMNLYISPNKVH